MVRGMILFLLLVLDDFDGELIVMCSFTEERCVVNQVRIVVVGGILIEPSSSRALRWRGSQRNQVES